MIQSSPPRLGDLRSQSSRRIIVIGDVHGCYDPLIRLLRLAGVVDKQSNWIGDSTSLVLLGDLEDEGAESREVIRLTRGLQASAPYRVRVLMGNHEIMLLAGRIREKTYLNFETAWSFARDHPELYDALLATAVPRLTTEEVARKW